MFVRFQLLQEWMVSIVSGLCKISPSILSHSLFSGKPQLLSTTAVQDHRDYSNMFSDFQLLPVFPTCLFSVSIVGNYNWPRTFYANNELHILKRRKGGGLWKFSLQIFCTNCHYPAFPWRIANI